MTLSQIVEAISEHEKHLVLFNCDPGDPIVEDLRVYFQSQNVRIEGETTASGAPANVAVLSDRESVLSIEAVSTLRELLENVPPGTDAIGIADGEYESILGHLKETTFTSYDSEQMLYATREIEDRARRVRAGTIHAGFQRLSELVEQRSIYADLAARGLDVHAYGVPDTTPPDIEGATIHAVENDEIAETWFVAFDGGDEDSQKCALLAEERGDGSFFGTWTYDPTIVDSILGHLEETYLAADRTQPQSGP
ncbi:putative sensor protein [Halorhabdus utahensis DSM 12940]|uniref:Putative sensor protein n=1 Tax=Halorhabdus utahensis (strain DSM 12940 / JCM 11049 / AX-2) TaxID=519442 RepID=C7NVJ7_HALUD|nr:DICT sensory domain-containing protein [Halorhabdus utahensis]ACV12520.1 putative sensor protein [Halorhabdus utahensis DSM 12940]